MDEIKLGKQRERGARAQALLDSDSLKEAFDYLHDQYLKAWRNTSGTDVQGRERLFQAVNILDKIREQLMTWAADGKIAAKDLEALWKQQKASNR